MQVNGLIGGPFIDRNGAECYRAEVTGMIPPLNEWREDYDWILYTQNIAPAIIRDHLLEEAIVEGQIGYATSSPETLRRERKARKRVQTTRTKQIQTSKIRKGTHLFEGLRFLWGVVKLQDVTRFLPEVPESSVDRLQCGQVSIEVGAGVVYYELDNYNFEHYYKHVLFVTDILMNGIVGGANVRRARPQVVGYRLDYLEKSSAPDERIHREASPQNQATYGGTDWGKKEH